jgi:hypothetical protein
MQSEMGSSTIDFFKWATNYLGECSIGDEGCEYLSRTQWQNLKTIYFSKLVEMKSEIT